MGTVRARTRSIADAHLARGDALGWFEEVYAAAGDDAAAIPWADRAANPALLTWLDGPFGTHLRSGRALVVGCGLGDDAEELSARGFEVTAFDVAPRAVAWAARRFPTTRVHYETADLLAPPERYLGAFDLVFEAYTLQSLPAGIRPRAVASLARFVAPGGRLVIVARGREEGPTDLVDGPPWPLAPSELEPLLASKLSLLARGTFEDDAWRFVATYERGR